MYTYIHNSISKYVELENRLDAKSNVIVSDWAGYQAGGWLLLSAEQLVFKEANPAASKQEVFNMTLNPVIEPEPHVPTMEEKLPGLMSMFVPQYINTIDMDNNTALYYKEFHPQWSVFVGLPLSKSDRVQYNDRLFRVRQDIATVLENQQPGSTGMGAIYEEINETNAGTQADPIPYDPVAGMELTEGKYYSQNGATYLCTRSTGQAVNHPLSALVGLYVRAV